MAKKVIVEKKKTERDFFDDLLKNAGVEIPIVTKANVHPTKFFSTGSLMLNALVSGTIFGGLASNKITALAGEESTGKTFIALQAVKHFLVENPKGQVLIFDSEDDPSKTNAVMAQRGIDTSRVRVKLVKSIQEFRQLAINVIDSYLEKPKSERLPMFFLLDSLGNLSTLKELHDTQKGALNKKGEDVRDMTRTSLIRGLFRVLTIKLGEADVPLLITNHTYETMDPYGAKKTMSGGGGLKYAASTIIFLSKKKYRLDGDKTYEVLGSLLTAELDKSRFTRFGLKAEVLLRHESGLDTYWGLFDFAHENGLLVTGTGIPDKKDVSGTKNGIKVNSYQFPDGQIGTRKEIEADSGKFFNTEINLNALDELAKKSFLFGVGEHQPIAVEDEDEEPESDTLDLDSLLESAEEVIKE